MKASDEVAGEHPSFTDTEVFEMLRRVSTATLSSQLHRRGYEGMVLTKVAPLRPDLTMAGRAVTLRYLPARKDLADETFDNRTNKQRLAVELVGPGDVLVIEARGDVRAATLGAILATRMKARGANGIVTDGAFRDASAIARLGFPAYARGRHPDMSFTVHHPAEINVPIACGGSTVVPGDVLVGDAEGVIVVPRHLAAEVAVDGLEQERREVFLAGLVESGRSIIGVYPPDEATLQAYEAWKNAEGAGLP
jgi:regulator of RNase E activity RraA